MYRRSVINDETKICFKTSERKPFPVIFEPHPPEVDQQLLVGEVLAKAPPGTSMKIVLPIQNPTSTEICLPSKMQLGVVSRVSAVIPLELQVGRGLRSPAKDVGDPKPRRGDLERQQPSSSRHHAQPLSHQQQNSRHALSPSTSDVTINQLSVNDGWLPPVDLSHLPVSQRREVEEILMEENHVFSRSKNDIGQIDQLKLKLDLYDQTPVRQRYRSIPKPLYEEVKNYLNDLLTNDWIKKSYSSYWSPMVCVIKKDGSLRLCVDYRQLNQKIIPDKMPIPRIQDILDGLGMKSWFSTLDMAKDYHQGFMHEDSRHLTAFSTPWALFDG